MIQVYYWIFIFFFSLMVFLIRRPINKMFNNAYKTLFVIGIVFFLFFFTIRNVVFKDDLLKTFSESNLDKTKNLINGLQTSIIPTDLCPLLRYVTAIYLITRIFRKGKTDYYLSIGIWNIIGAAVTMVGEDNSSFSQYLFSSQSLFHTPQLLIGIVFLSIGTVSIKKDFVRSKITILSSMTLIFIMSLVFSISKNNTGISNLDWVTGDYVFPREIIGLSKNQIGLTRFIWWLIFVALSDVALIMTFIIKKLVYSYENKYNRDINNGPLWKKIEPFYLKKLRFIEKTTFKYKNKWDKM